MNGYEHLEDVLVNGVYRPMNFTIFNFISEDGYVREVSAIDRVRYDVDDFEYFILPLDEEDRNNIKSDESETIEKYEKFKWHIEKECQKSVHCGVFIMKDLGIVVSVKPKTYSIGRLLVTKD